MYDPLAEIRIRIKSIISDSIIRVAEQNDISVSAVPDFSVTEAKDPIWGDYSSNAAFCLSDLLKIEPRKLSKLLTENVDLNSTPFSEVIFSDPGFINFRLSDSFLIDSIHMSDSVPFSYGSSDYSVIIWGNTAGSLDSFSPSQFRARAVFESLISIFIKCGYQVSVNNKQQELFDSLSRQIAVFSESDWDLNPSLSRFGRNVEKIAVQTYKTANENLYYDNDLAFLLALVCPGLPAKIPEGLHKRTSKDNPVYYLRYTYSWILSHLRGLERTITLSNRVSDASLSPEERALLIQCLKFSSTLKLSSARCDPSIAARYLVETAKKYDLFYKNSRLLSNDMNTTILRIELANQVRIILEEGMDMFHLDHPEWL